MIDNPDDNRQPSGNAASLRARIFARSENYVAGRYWMLEALFLAVFVSILFSANVDDRLWGELNGSRWVKAYYQKIEHPLLDVAKINPPQNHEAKLNFRLTVPVILHVLHVPSSWLWELPALAACGTCALVLIACVFAYRVTQDRVCGLFAVLAVSCTYIGSFGFVMCYDSIAISQLALAMLPGMNWFFRALLVFTASFTDERGFLAAPFLLLQTLCSAKPDEKGGGGEVRHLRTRLLLPESLAVFAGMGAYCVGRLALEHYAGLTAEYKGIGFPAFFAGLPFLPAGFWMALKGGWLLLVVAVASLWRERRYGVVFMLVAYTTLFITSGFFVDDIGRSVAYVFPVFLVALMILANRENISRMRVYCLTAFVISLIAGNYNIWRGEIVWFRPAAADIFSHLLHNLMKYTMAV